MVQAQLGRWWSQGWTAYASVAAHCLALTVLALLGRPRPLPPTMTRVIVVDILPAAPAPRPTEVTPPPDTTNLKQPSLAPPLPDRPVDATGDRPAARDDGMVHATALHAAAILADPANAELRQNFESLASSEQVIQLCNIEALEQIRPDDDGPAPDAVVGYAFDDLAVDDLLLTAEGGAYRRERQWFRVRYRCSVAPDLAGVAAFDYALGEPIPRDDWEAHFLNLDDEGSEP